MQAAKRILGVCVFLFVFCGYVSTSLGSDLFSDNFESGSLSPNWTSTNGALVVDPLNAINHALDFTANKSAGDAFTAGSFALTSGVTYTFSFDYLGTNANAFALAGISPVNTTVPSAGWVFASQSFGSATLLANDGVWHSYSMNFTDSFLNSIGGSTVYLTFEEASGTPGTAFFDNVKLSAVPEPGSLLLLGVALAGIAASSRRGKN